MAVHVFVDESQRSRYLICATLVAPNDLAQNRRELRGLLLRGQRRLHFAQERAQRRRYLLAAIAKLPLTTNVYSSSQKEPAARTNVMDALLLDLVAVDADRLVIERRESSQDERERQQIARAIRAGRSPGHLRYHHLAGHEEPLLWASDAVAWAYGAGGEWRRRAASLIARHIDVD